VFLIVHYLVLGTLAPGPVGSGLVLKVNFPALWPVSQLGASAFILAVAS
jgi:hypothetical protein